MLVTSNVDGHGWNLVVLVVDGQEDVFEVGVSTYCAQVLESCDLSRRALLLIVMGRTGGWRLSRGRGWGVLPGGAVWGQCLDLDHLLAGVELVLAEFDKVVDVRWVAVEVVIKTGDL